MTGVAEPAFTAGELEIRAPGDGAAFVWIGLGQGKDLSGFQLDEPEPAFNVPEGLVNGEGTLRAGVNPTGGLPSGRSRPGEGEGYDDDEEEGKEQGEGQEGTAAQVRAA